MYKRMTDEPLYALARLLVDVAAIIGVIQYTIQGNQLMITHIAFGWVLVYLPLAYERFRANRERDKQVQRVIEGALEKAR